MNRSILNLLSSILVKIRYSSKKDPFRDFYRLINPKQINNENVNNEIILITPIRISPVSNLFEGLIAKFYELKGKDVRLLICNQSVEYCENFTKYNNRIVSCALCKKEQKRFIDLFKLKYFNADSCITLDELKYIKRLINLRDFKIKDDFYFEGVDLYESITSAVMRHTLRSEIEDCDRLIKKYAFTAFFYSRVITNLNKKYSIKTLISSHGIYSTWGSIIATCKKLKIYTVIWGRGYIGQGKLLFGINNSYHEDFILEAPSSYNNIIIGSEEQNEVFSYYLKKTQPNSKVDYVNYYKNIRNDNKVDLQILKKKIPHYKKTFGMYTNIPWDGEMLKTTDCFPTTRSFVRSVINWFEKNSDCLLIIRAHPAEVSREEGRGTETFEELLKSEYKFLPQNIIFIQPDSSITSYMVSDIVNANILFGSTMSLELAIQKKLIIQGGKNQVSFKNIVYDAHDYLSLYSYLDKVKNNELFVLECMYENTIKYAYYWIKKRHIEDTTIVLEKLLFQKYNFNNLEEFLNDETLNFVTNKIDNKERIVYE